MLQSPAAIKFEKYIYFALAFFIAAIIVGLLYSLAEVSPEFRAGIITAIGTISLGLYTQNAIKRREIESRLFSLKAEAYGKFFTLIFDIFSAVKSGGEVDEEDMTKRITDFTREIMIWGDATVLKGWNKCRIDAEKAVETGGLAVLQPYAKFFRLLRGDLGHTDETVDDLDYLRCFLTSEAQAELEEYSVEA